MKFTPEQMVLTNMKLCNIIKGEDTMIWYSPNKDFHIVINKYDNTLPFLGSKYIITLELYNNLNVKLYETKFNEIDAIRILNSFQSFLDCEGQSYANFSIYLNNPSNPRLDVSYFFVQNIIRDDIDELDENNNLNEDYYRDILFQWNIYNTFQEKIVNILNIYLKEEELMELCFDIFFVALLDTQLDPIYQNDIDNLALRLYYDTTDDFNKFNNN